MPAWKVALLAPFVGGGVALAGLATAAAAFALYVLAAALTALPWVLVIAGGIWVAKALGVF